jgi:hypothetical protein
LVLFDRAERHGRNLGGWKRKAIGQKSEPSVRPCIAPLIPRGGKLT